MQEDSLNKRYFYKLSTNIVGMLVNLVTQAIIPRSLGPRAYGDFNFLTNFFSQVAGFLDMGTSTAFYTKVSQRQSDQGLISFYGIFLVVMGFFIVLFVVMADLMDLSSLFWPDQALFYIYLAAGFIILTWITRVLNQMADAYGVTVWAEKALMTQKVLLMILLFVLFSIDRLNLTRFFFCNYLSLIFIGMAFLFIINYKVYPIRRNWRLSFVQLSSYAKEFYEYSSPLFIYAIIGMIIGILDRWFLQVYSGSMEQGFFGLAYQIGAICFLFNSAMTPLFIRDFSIAFSNRNHREMSNLFSRYIPLFYSVAAFFSCFVAVQADKVIQIFGGKQFSGAYLTVAIMAFFPLHQTYGQLSGSVFLATGQTVLYRNIGVFFMLLGIPLAYFLMAPLGSMGRHLGAYGLAIKTVLLQIIWVNVQLYFNARMLNLNFMRYLVHQFVIVVCLIILAVFATSGVDYIWRETDEVMKPFLTSGLLYTVMTVILFFLCPTLFGLKKNDIQIVVNLWTSKIRS